MRIRPQSGPETRPAVFKVAFYSYLGCPLPGKGPDGHFPSKIDSFGPVLVWIRAGNLILGFIASLKRSWARSPARKHPARAVVAMSGRGLDLHLPRTLVVRSSCSAFGHEQQLSRTYIRKLKSRFQFQFWAAFRPNLAPIPL